MILCLKEVIKESLYEEVYITAYALMARFLRPCIGYRVLVRLARFRYLFRQA